MGGGRLWLLEGYTYLESDVFSCFFDRISAVSRIREIIQSEECQQNLIGWCSGGMQRNIGFLINVSTIYRFSLCVHKTQMLLSDMGKAGTMCIC